MKGDLDTRILKIRYPKEFPRDQRSLNYFKEFKANEMRNLMFYGSICLENILKNEYFQHLILYVVAIRLLCQDELDKTDLKDAFILINHFYLRFRKLYGIENLTYKLHAHTHLIAQVCNYGPLHKISSFPFESNYFLLSIQLKLL